jgi:ABC-2 type transport system ATP-binding protein
VIAINTPEALVEVHKNNPEVISASRKGKITLEDVFIGLTGKALRT